MTCFDYVIFVMAIVLLLPLLADMIRSVVKALNY
jgi:hypothetical protein